MADVDISVLRKRQQKAICKKLVKQVVEDSNFKSVKGSYLELCFRVNALVGVRTLADYFMALKSHRAYSPETICRRFRERRREWEIERNPNWNPCDGYSFGNPYQPAAGTVEKRAKREVVFKEYYGQPRLNDFFVEGSLNEG